MLAYTDPGDLVLDPDCATGSVVVEAIRHGRRAIGLTTTPSHGALAIANISHARDQGAPGRAAILEGSPEQLPRLLRQAPAILDTDASRETPRHPAGSVRLILTAPAVGDLPGLLPSLRPVLAPGGFLLLALDQQHSDIPVGLGSIVDVAENSGLHYWQHVIALRVASVPGATVLLHSDVLAFRKPNLVAARRADARAVSA